MIREKENGNPSKRIALEDSYRHALPDELIRIIQAYPGGMASGDARENICRRLEASHQADQEMASYLRATWNTTPSAELVQDLCRRLKALPRRRGRKPRPVFNFEDLIFAHNLYTIRYPIEWEIDAAAGTSSRQHDGAAIRRTPGWRALQWVINEMGWIITPETLANRFSACRARFPAPPDSTIPDGQKSVPETKLEPE